MNDDKEEDKGNYYFVTYQAKKSSGPVIENALINMDKPIEYFSDIDHMVNIIVEDQNCHQTVIQNIFPLKGEKRPKVKP